MYIIDSNCFIQNYRSYNPMDIALSFWHKIADLVKEGNIHSIDKVREELVKNKDDLSEWAKNMPQTFFFPIASVEMHAYFNIVNWASVSDYKPQAKIRFMAPDYADPYLIAYALSHQAENVTIVTEEVSARDSKKDIKLPDVCAHFNVRSIHFMEMLREMKVTY